MDQCGILVERASANRGGRQGVPLDHDFVCGILRLGAARGDDGRDGLALPDDAVEGQHMLRRRDHRRQVVHRPLPRRAHLGDLGAGDDPRVGDRRERRAGSMLRIAHARKGF